MKFTKSEMSLLKRAELIQSRVVKIHLYIATKKCSNVTLSIANEVLNKIEDNLTWLELDLFGS